MHYRMLLFFADDVILAITNSGTIKMWSINIHTVKVILTVLAISLRPGSQPVN